MDSRVLAIAQSDGKIELYSYGDELLTLPSVGSVFRANDSDAAAAAAAKDKPSLFAMEPLAGLVFVNPYRDGASHPTTVAARSATPSNEYIYELLAVSFHAPLLISERVCIGRCGDTSTRSSR